MSEQDQTPLHPEITDSFEAVATLLKLARESMPGFQLPRFSTEPPLEPGSTPADTREPEAEARYQTLVEQIPAVIFMASFRNGRSEIYVSPHVEKLLGYTAREWIEDPILWYQRLHPDDKDRWNREFARTVSSAEPFKADYRFLARDGSVVWIHGEAKIVRDEKGRPSFVQGIGYDVTDLKRTQADLRRTQKELERQIQARTVELEARQTSEELLRDLFESSPDAIAVMDGDGRIVRVNSQAEKLFGYQREEMVGQPVEMLMPARFRLEHVHHRAGYMEAPRTRPMGEGLDLYGRRKDGSEFAVDIMLSPMQPNDSGVVIAVVRDVTQRKQNEQRIAESLEKEALLRRELHHRVKNNLQVISSMLFLQSTHVSDPNTLEILRESRNRTRAIGLIHEKLYHTGDLARIEFSGYLRELAENLFHAYRVDPEAVILRTSKKGAVLGLDAAIPCGLILNELISNALKHGLPEGRKGEICIDLQQTDSGQFTLTVRDNGVGFPKDFDFEKTRTLGLKLVRDLTRQLDGTVKLETSGGASVTITFEEHRHETGDTNPSQHPEA